MDIVATLADRVPETSIRDGTTQSSTSGPRRIRPCAVCREIFKFILKAPIRNNWSEFQLAACSRHSRLRLEYRASSTCDICIFLLQAIPSDCRESLINFSFGLMQEELKGDPDYNDTTTVFHHMTLTFKEVQHRFRLLRISGDAPSVIGRKQSEEADLPLASTWISECQQFHPECGDLGPTRLPSRLIFIGEDAEPRLMETAGRIGIYVALSHCWGSEQALQTNRLNIAAHKRCIELKDMPKNYRDAIIVARKLGFSYIWIDSLCIVQDDSDDWDCECARMGEIYANASLTVAAEDAANPSVGILHKRDVIGRVGCEFSTQPGGPESELVLRVETARETPSEGLPGRDFLHEYALPTALNKRAWALQEQLLSRRVLQFRSDHLSFICNRHLRSETLHQPILYEGFPRYAFSYWENTVPKNILVVEDQDLHQVWIQVVANASRRLLTYESDKLPSIAAVATLLQRRHGDKYLAGIWQQDISRQIAWYVDTNMERRSRVPTTRKLPSWTWASRDYPIKGLWNLFLRQSVSYDFKLISAEISTAAGDVLSNKAPGRLVLSGKMIDVKATPVYPNMQDALYKFVETSSCRQFYAHLHLDIPRMHSNVDPEMVFNMHPIKLSLLLLGHDRTLLEEKLDSDGPDKNHGWSAIVLQRKKGKTNTFRRVGLVEYEYLNAYFWSKIERRENMEKFEENGRFVKWILTREESVIKLV